jgi:hypothetical protein
MVRIPADQRSVGGARPGPYAALAARARRASDGALVLAAAAGVVAVTVLVLWRPAWWAPLMPALAVGSFGAWGVAEREAAERRAAPPTTSPAAPPATSSAVLRALVGAQWLAVAVGTGATLLGAYAALGALFGTVIS